MSTAGKVLTIIIAVVALVWIYLFAQVGQLNRNHGAAIERQKEQLENNQAQLRDLQVQVFRLGEQVRKERAVTANQLESLRGSLADLRSRVTTNTETLVRVQIQLEEEQLIARTAEAARDRREQEREEAQRQLNETITEVTQSVAENEALIDRLTSLRDEYQTVVAENRDLLERARQESNTAVSLTQ